jgi:hypothetical protein
MDSAARMDVYQSMNYFWNHRYYLLMVALFFVSCSPVAYKNLECTCYYGGSTQSVTVKPVTDPYKVEAMQITVKNSENKMIKTDFLFKVVYIMPPADDAAINIYVYYLSEAGQAPVHQLKFLPPFPVRDVNQPFGFTGMQNVYEPSLGRVFQYYCLWK